MKLYVGYAPEDRSSALAIVGGLREQYVILDPFDGLKTGESVNNRIRACGHEADRIVVLCSTTFKHLLFRDALLEVAIAKFRAHPNAVAAVILDGARAPEQLKGCPQFPFSALLAQNFAPLREFLEAKEHDAPAAPQDTSAAKEPSPGRGRGAFPASRGDETDHALELLRSVTHVPLKEKCVIQNYFRWEERTVNKLRGWADRIKRSMSGGKGAIRNFVIGGSPGTGKTFFVAQVAAELGDTIAFHKLDFSKGSAASVKATVEQVERSTRPTLLVIDEVDTPSADLALYEASFQILEVNETVFPRVCIVLGSSEGGYHSVVQSLIARPPKCRDFGTRVGAQNGFDVPEAILADRLAVVAGQIQMLMPTIVPDVKRIEKLAAYYILTNPELGNPRGIRDLIAPAVERFHLRGAEKGILFEDLFPIGESAARQFLMQHQSLAGSLEDTYVRFE